MIPVTTQTAHAGAILHWCGSDTLARYNNNIRDKKSRVRLEECGWIDTTIEYAFNSHGYRDEEFDQRPCGLALGCSYTFGTGLHSHQIWPTRLSNTLDLKIWNLGVGGAGLDTIFRIADYWVDKLQPQFVCMMVPNKQRFEIANGSGYLDALVPAAMPSSYDARYVHFMDDHTIEINYRKNLLAIQQICKDIPLYTTDLNTGGILPDNGPCARDIMHSGETWHREIANLYYRKINE